MGRSPPHHPHVVIGELCARDDDFTEAVERKRGVVKVFCWKVPGTFPVLIASGRMLWGVGQNSLHRTEAEPKA